MLFAFLSTKPTRVGAGSQLGADEFAVGGGDATDDFRRGQADIRTIEIGTNTCYLPGDVVFSETSVRTSVAGLGARIGSGYAFHRTRMITGRFEGMGLEHLFNVTHGLSFVSAGAFAWPDLHCSN